LAKNRGTADPACWQPAAVSVDGAKLGSQSRPGRDLLTGAGLMRADRAAGHAEGRFFERDTFKHE